MNRWEGGGRVNKNIKIPQQVKLYGVHPSKPPQSQSKRNHLQNNASTTTPMYVTWPHPFWKRGHCQLKQWQIYQNNNLGHVFFHNNSYICYLFVYSFIHFRPFYNAVEHVMRSQSLGTCSFLQCVPQLCKPTLHTCEGAYTVTGLF